MFINRTETVDGNLGAEFQHADAGGYWVGSYSYTGGSSKLNNHREYWYGRGWLRRQQTPQLISGRPWAPLSFQEHGPQAAAVERAVHHRRRGTVRGYPVSTYSADIGYTLSAELHHPMGSTTLGDGVTQMLASGFFFVDFGHVRPYRPPNSTLRNYEQLTSAGWGFSTAIGKHVTTKTTSRTCSTRSRTRHRAAIPDVPAGREHLLNDGCRSALRPSGRRYGQKSPAG